MSDESPPSRLHLRKRHPIAVVARRTGLSPTLLRAWERRYEAVIPGRTATGRRLYSDEDIARLGLMRQALAGGHRIGEVASLDLPRLEALIREDGRLEEGTASTGIGGRRSAGGPAGTGATAVSVPPGPRDTTEAVLADALAAVEALDRERLERSLSEGMVALGRSRLRAEVITPLMDLIGQRWQQGRLRIVNEHLASSVVRALLAPPPGDGLRTGVPRLLVTTPVGQRHEFGALLAAAAAADHGWDTVYLGPDLPAEEIAAAARRLDAAAVALSLIYPVDGPRLHEQLRELRRALGPRTAILVGGRAAGASRQVLLEIGAVTVEDATSLPAVLDQLELDGN